MTDNLPDEPGGALGEPLSVNDVRLHFWSGLAAPPPSSDSDIYVHKDRPFVSRLDAVLERIRPRQIVEIGILHGGSTIYWQDKYKPDCLLAFELAPDAPHLVSYLQRHRLTENVHVCFGVSQTDAATLRAAMRDHARDRLIDAVIDDASHQYFETRTTIEVLLPFVRPGGIYIIEDWAWGHSANWPAQLWAQQPLLSPLLVELILICGHGSGVIDKVDIDPNFAVIRRGNASLAQDGGFKLRDHYVSRDFSLAL
jgi:hypothetical protein